MKRLINIVKGDFELDYWTCQLLAWGIIALYWLYAVITQFDYGLFYSLLNYVLDVAIGLGLTHLYRNYAKGKDWNRRALGNLMVSVIPAIV
jgi:two-component system LytT family sensor kinase